MPSDAPLAFFYDGNRMMGWNEQDGPYWHGTGSSVEDRLYEAIEGMAELHAQLVDNEATLAARDAEIADMREVLRLAARAILSWAIEVEYTCDLDAEALRAIVAILPDALDGAPEWIVEAVKQEKPE